MNTRFFALAALALTLAACDNDNENKILNNGPVAAQFTAAISNEVTATPSTRVSGTDGTQWDPEDCIGITGAGYTNIPYVTSGDGSFTPESAIIIYYEDTQTKTFSAYYPYKPDSELEDGFAKVNTSDDQGPGIDFLFATGAEGSTYNREVSFTGDHAFHHCMSLIKFTFKEGLGISFSETEPASYTLDGLKHEGTFDTGTGTTDMPRMNR